MTTIGEVGQRKGDEPQCDHLSYFARLTDAATFADLASGEIKRPGVEQAREVAAINDGAEWIPTFVQSQRADALRILDFAHAAQYVSDIGTPAGQAGVELPPSWLHEQWHTLKWDGPRAVLAEIERLSPLAPVPEMDEKMAYLRKREGQMQYQQYLADGWPIGSGMAKSGNKLVVQARLKGAGMHWERKPGQSHAGVAHYPLERPLERGLAGRASRLAHLSPPAFSHAQSPGSDQSRWSAPGHLLSLTSASPAGVLPYSSPWEDSERTNRGTKTPGAAELFSTSHSRGSVCKNMNRTR